MIVELSAFRKALFIAIVLLAGLRAFSDIEEDLVIYFSFDNVDGTMVVNGADEDIHGVLEWEAHPTPGYLNMGVMLNPYAAESTPGDDFVRVRANEKVNVT